MPKNRRAFESLNKLRIGDEVIVCERDPIREVQTGYFVDSTNSSADHAHFFVRNKEGRVREYCSKVYALLRMPSAGLIRDFQELKRDVES